MNKTYRIYSVVLTILGSFSLFVFLFRKDVIVSREGIENLLIRVSLLLFLAVFASFLTCHFRKKSMFTIKGYLFSLMFITVIPIIYLFLQFEVGMPMPLQRVIIAIVAYGSEVNLASFLTFVIIRRDDISKAAKIGVPFYLIINCGITLVSCIYGYIGLLFV